MKLEGAGKQEMVGELYSLLLISKYNLKGKVAYSGIIHQLSKPDFPFVKQDNEDDRKGALL